MEEQEEKKVWIKLTELESSCKSAHKRLDEVNEDVKKVSEDVKKMNELLTEVKYMREDLSKVTKKLNEIESKPQKRWDTLITAAISALTSGILGFVVAQLIGG